MRTTGKLSLRSVLHLVSSSSRNLPARNRRISAVLRISRNRLARKAACLALAASLLLFPLPKVFFGLAGLRAFAAEATDNASSLLHRAVFSLDRAFRKRQVPQTLGDRQALVAGIHIFPSHLIAYSGETISFSGLPMDSFSQQVQGAKLSWDTSDHTKMTVDDAGRATILSAGLVWVTCQVGLVSGRAPVLIKPGIRPAQSPRDWNNDQDSITDSGVSTSGMAFLKAAYDKLAPTVEAQGGGSLDFLWNYVPNWIGAPRNAAVMPSRIGAILPESKNVEAALPLFSQPGRGVNMSLTLYDNTRVWFRNGNAIYYDPLPSYPAPGFSLGFGYIYTYMSSFSPFDTAYLYVKPDGTPVYLGHGSANSYATYTANDGSHVVYFGNASGGTMTFPDGTIMTMSLVNNIIQATAYQDTNGNIETFAYEDSSQGYSPLALAETMDSLGRTNVFNYDVNKRLSTITTPGQNGTNTTLWTFNYGTHNFQYTFSGLTAYNTPGNHVNVSVLNNVQEANGNGLSFTYSDYGMPYQIGILRAGTSRANANFNYPTSGTTSISDAPAFTSWTETPGSGTYNVSSSTGSQTITFTIARPDSSTLNLTRSTNTSSISNGLMTQSEIKNGSGGSMRKTVFTYAADPGGGTQVTNTTAYDDIGEAVQTAYQYNSGGFVTVKKEYGFSSSVQRQTSVSYVTAGGAFKPSEIDIYDETVSPAKQVSKRTYKYDAYGDLGGMQDYGGTATPPGRISSYNSASVTNRGNMTGETDWYDIANNLSITRLAQLDIFGNTVKAQLSCCNTKTMTMDQSTYWSNATSVTKGASGGPQYTTTYTYDFDTSKTTGMSDPNGVTQNYQYDQYLRPTVIGLPAGATATATYGDATMQATSSLAYTDGATNKTVSQTRYMDGWGEVIETVDPANNRVNYTYDGMGRLSTKTNPFPNGGPLGAATSYQYDPLGRQMRITLPDGNILQTSHAGSTVTLTDQVGREIQQQYDGFGRLAVVKEQDPATGALTQTTTYTYDMLDDLIQVNQSGQIRSFAYDALGRATYDRIPEQTATINDGTGALWTSKYTYTDFGAVSTKTDARGVVITDGYDSMNRLISVSYNTSNAPGVASTPSVTYTYDNSTTSDTQGLLLSVTVGALTESYGYDSFERRSTVTDSINGKNYAIAYQYNGAGQITQLTYPSARVLPYIYDSAGRLLSIGGTAGGNGTNGYKNSISYTASEHMSSFNLGNGVAETISYDPNRLMQTGVQATLSGATLMNLTYNYNAAAGQMGTGTSAGDTGQIAGVSGTINGQTESASYFYDLDHRLTAATQTSNGQTAGRSYALDAFGNRLSETDTIAQSQIEGFTLQQSGGIATNRITSVNISGTNYNYTYDNAGNVTSDGSGNTYTYDAENRLVSVSGAVSIQNSYDFQNRRVACTEGGATTHYLWNGNMVLAEHNGATGANLIDYIPDGNGSFVAKIQSNGTTSYFVKDKFSERLRLDSSGNIQGVMGTLAYGEDFAESGSQEKHHFMTYDRDSLTGADYAINRQYVPIAGRFSQVDKKAASPLNPQEWNRYAYVTDDPVNRTDPTGLDGCEEYEFICGDFWCDEIVCFIDGPSGIGDAGGVGGGEGQKTQKQCDKNLTKLLKDYRDMNDDLFTVVSDLGVPEGAIDDAITETVNAITQDPSLRGELRHNTISLGHGLAMHSAAPYDTLVGDTKEALKATEQYLNDLPGIQGCDFSKGLNGPLGEEIRKAMNGGTTAEVWSWLLDGILSTRT